MTAAVRTRAAAVLILLGLLLVLWLGPAAAYIGYLGANADRIDMQTRLLQRYRALTHAAVAAPGATAPAESLPLFPDVPDTQAVALLQEAVKKAAAAARVQVESLQVLKADPLPGAVRIGLRIRATGDTDSLARLLYAIETARPILYPDDLQIQASPAPAGGNGAPPLQLQIDISGFKSGPST